MAVRLNEIVSVAPRYARAINLERDASSEAALEGYVITSTAQALLSRLGISFADSGRHHAWTVTGPYGSGKSAFLLFLPRCSVLNRPQAGGLPVGCSRNIIQICN